MSYQTARSAIRNTLVTMLPKPTSQEQRKTRDENLTQLVDAIEELGFQAVRKRLVEKDTAMMEAFRRAGLIA